MWREVRWRWTLKELRAAARMDRKRWADPGDLKCCVLRFDAIGDFPFSERR